MEQARGANIEGVPMFRIVKKVKLLKKDLESLNLRGGHLSEMVAQLRNDLFDYQRILGQHPLDIGMRKLEAQLYPRI